MLNNKYAVKWKTVPGESTITNMVLNNFCVVEEETLFQMNNKSMPDI